TEPSGYDELYRVYGNGSFLGVAAVDSGDLIPQKVLI
ncbi:MAG: tRNA pseudouridine(55) synthase TruB, partial [Mogibacterium sp.]|nr:tRNA pseudouridine(55) synthase TruB [Mogibacterium sp.]